MSDKNGLTFNQIKLLYKIEIEKDPTFEAQLCAIYDYLIDNGLNITDQTINKHVMLVGEFNIEERARMMVELAKTYPNLI